MEQFIRISAINDFLFCPRSLYLHSIYEGYDTSLFNDKSQVVGLGLHASIDENRYSTSKHILQGLSIASVEYGLMGKIDLYDAKKLVLVERKTRIKTLHEGYRMQMYAQYVCMVEMGYEILYMYLRSMRDNKRYALLPPGEHERERLRYILGQMRRTTPATVRTHRCARCKSHIYDGLGW